MSIITEIVTMKIVIGLEANEFISIVSDLEKNYHSKQVGFIDTELLYNEKTNEWIMIQHWESMEQLTSASKQIFKDPAASAFVQSVDPKYIKMVMLPQIRKW